MSLLTISYSKIRILTICIIKRNLTASKPTGSSLHNTYAKSGLETRICVQSYRLFFVSDTEDEVWKNVGKQERDAASKNTQDRREKDLACLKQFGGTATASNKRM